MTAFRTQIASDIIRDGIGVELLDANGEIVAEIFRSDKTNRVFVATFGEEVPLEGLAQAIQRFRERFTHFEDGMAIQEFEF